MIRALVRAHRWKRLPEQNKYRSVSELAEAEGPTRSFVNRLLRLTLLAPDIVEAILDGRQPKALQLENLTRALPSAWDEQRHHLLRRASTQHSVVDPIAGVPDDTKATRANQRESPGNEPAFAGGVYSAERADELGGVGRLNGRWE